MPIVKVAAGMLYHHLLKAGVRIYEYCERPLHGKVALADDEWATVGSSNLDPLSLALNLEANVVIRDRAFNARLHERLSHLMCNTCNEITHEGLGELKGWGLVRSFLAYHFTRRYPAWASWLPRHVPRLLPAAGKPLEAAAAADAGAR
jgi:cardiolipin synthase